MSLGGRGGSFSGRWGRVCTGSGRVRGKADRQAVCHTLQPRQVRSAAQSPGLARVPQGPEVCTLARCGVSTAL